MTRDLSVATVACAAIIALTTNPAVAQSQPTLAQYDFDGDQFFAAGAEMDALAEDPSLTFKQQTLITLARQDPIGGVGVREVLGAAPPSCETVNRLHLRGGIEDFTVTATGYDRGALDGATLSYDNDAVAGQEVWAVDGALFWSVGNPCVRRDAPRDTVRVVRYGFAPYLDFQGSQGGAAPDSSQLRLGVLAEFQLFGGEPFATQILSASPYVITDFEGEGQAIGFVASWTPFDLGLNLNASIGSAPRWRLSGSIDLLNVSESGQTGLAEGEYAWAGLTLGTSRAWQPEGTHGFFYDANLEAFWDFANQEDAVLGTLKLGMYLNESRSSAITLEHRRGSDYRRPGEQERTTLSLAFSF